MSRKRGRSERGASAVEFALILPVFSLLLFSIVDFGAVYANQIALREGVRDGARAGGVAQFGTSNTCVNAFSTGMTPSPDIQDLMCTVKTRIGITPFSSVYVKVLFDSSDQTFSVNNGLVVCAQTPARSLTGATSQLLGTGFLRTKVETAVERTTGPEIAGEEAPPPGSDWSWCTASGATP